MELPEQERVKALLEMPCVQFVDDDPSHHEHRTSTVCSRLVNETQIHQSLLRVRAPPEAGHVLLCRQRSKLTEPNKCGPLRQEHFTLECAYKPPIQSASKNSEAGPLIGLRADRPRRTRRAPCKPAAPETPPTAPNQSQPDAQTSSPENPSASTKPTPGGQSHRARTNHARLRPPTPDHQVCHPGEPPRHTASPPSAAAGHSSP